MSGRRGSSGSSSTPAPMRYGVCSRGGLGARMGREGAGQGIGFAIAGALAIVDDVVVGREGGCPSSMVARGSPSCRKVFQVLVVSVDTD